MIMVTSTSLRLVELCVAEVAEGGVASNVIPSRSRKDSSQIHNQVLSEMLKTDKSMSNGSEKAKFMAASIFFCVLYS